MKTLHLSIMILSFVLLSVMLSQNVTATVPLVEIMLSGTANNQNCENKCVISQTVTVQKGSAVEWINNDLIPHMIVSGNPEDKDNGTLFDSGEIWVGTSFTHNFNDVGVYHYFERDHPENTGIINVTDGNPQSISSTMPSNGSGFIPEIYSDFFFSGHILPNVAIPVGLDFTNTGNVTLYDVHLVFVNSPVLQNFKTNFGNFTLKVGQEKTIWGTIYSPSEISNVSSSVNWMVYAKNQNGTVGSKEFHRSINLANISTLEGWSSYPVILPPLQQGVTVDGIECKKELQLIIKLDDYSPACVRPSTNQTLIERGWGESMASLMEPPAIKKMEIIGLQQNYKISQPIHAIIKYTGWMYGREPDVKILDINGTQIWFNCPECSLYATSYAAITASFFTTSYNVTDANGQYPIINKTGTYTMITSLGNETAKFNVIP